jgi:replicative DNA helicase
MLTSINGLNIAADTLDDSDFYYTEHKIIFGILKNFYKNDKPADIHIVCEELKRQGKLQNVGGAGYITTLAQYAGTSAHIEEYAQIVHDKSVLRRMINASQLIEKKALDQPENVEETLDEAQQLFYQISQSSRSMTGVLIGEILSGAKVETQTPFLKILQERQEKFQENGGKNLGITGIPSRFNDLDKMLNGLNNSNLMILAARPAMGKTALAINIAENICFQNNIPVGIFSLEMSAEQLVHRIICSQAEVESDKIKTGSLNGEEYQRIVETVHNIQNHPLIIDDQPGLKITDLRARARRMKESWNIGFMVIDYLQLLSGSGNFRVQENRQLEISEISRMLKNLAREINIPILCLSQLSRKVEERTGHRPVMSDLRESGCLTGDTIIKNAETGKIYTIKELAEREVQSPIPVFGVNSELKLGIHQMSKAFYSGKKEVFELKTRTGRTIKSSANHPFLKINGWTRLDELQINDKVALPRETGCKLTSSPVSNDELILLAHLLGDGCVLPNQPYHYTSADEKNIEVVSQSANRLFGINSRIVKQKNWYHVYLPSPYRVTHNKYHPITNWFKKLDIERVRSYEKQIPSILFECSKEQIALFLHHLWATDGNISYKLLKGRKPSGNIYYSSSSKHLSIQVQQLLLTLGIQSTLKTVKSARGYRNMYHLHIQSAPYQLKFLKEVGSYGKRGEIVPELIEKINQIETSPNVDIIPKEAWHSVIKESKEESELGWREVCSGLNTSYCGTTLFKSGISRQRMEKLYEIFKTEKVKNLARSDVYWDEIISIEKIGVEDVYDATVENVHNFVANDIIVHNSLEQDSDIVMFLLRREYYDAMDKPGMAELIVAKNRHGAIGTVNLHFRKELAQFANYTPITPPVEKDF